MAKKPKREVVPEEELETRGNEKESTLGNAVGKPRSAPSDSALLKELKFNTREQSFYESSYWPDSQVRPYNPDDLVQRYGDYSIYEDMLDDDQVDVCLQIKKDLVLGGGFEFICEEDLDYDDGEEELEKGEKPEGAENPAMPAKVKKPFAFPVEGEEAPEEDPLEGKLVEEDGGEGALGEEIPPSASELQEELNKKIRADLEIAFSEDIETDVEESFYEMLSAYEFGFSLTEKVWKYREDGTVTLKSLKTRHPASFLIHTDEYANIERFEQRGSRASIDIKPDALIHMVNNSKFQNPYGRSDLRSAFLAWTAKKEIVKFYAIWMEKNASETPVARYGVNAPPEAVDAIYNAIKNLQTKTALAIPKDVELDFLKSGSNGEAYVKGMNIFNMFIGRALMIPDLLGFQGSETSGGSYSLGKDQMKVFFQHIGKRKRAFEKRINKEIVRPFVLNNYGKLEKYPKFRLKEVDDEKSLELAKVWLEAVKGKLYKPSDEEINYFRKLVKFPGGAIEREAPPAPMQSGPDGKPLPPQPGNPPPFGDKSNPGKEMPLPEKQYAKVYSDLPGDYDKKVNYKSIKTTLEQARAKTMSEGKVIIAEMYADLMQQIREKKIVQSQDIEKVDKLKVKNLSKLRALLRRKFLEMNRDAKREASLELTGGVQYEAPLPHKDFMDFLEAELDGYIGKFEYTVTEQVRLKLIQAIKDGKPLSEVVGVLDDEGIALSETSLERFSRTKFTEVMNRGRMEFFESSGVVEAYQYSAILDDRTSDICDGLHGKVFEKDDAPIPPMHFNCRSLLVPITKYEDYKADKTVDGKNIDKFIDDNIGEGFSRQ